uniref:Uncharacterized protein n=1 Tax=Anopheles merus TaxID=30066 RepID=A0A182V6U0_ANOME
MIALMVPLMAQTMVPTRPLLTMQFSSTPFPPAGLVSSFIFIIGILRKDFRARFHFLRVSLPECCPYRWRFIAMRLCGTHFNVCKIAQGKAQQLTFPDLSNKIHHRKGRTGIGPSKQNT